MIISHPLVCLSILLIQVLTIGSVRPQLSDESSSAAGPMSNECLNVPMLCLNKSNAFECIIVTINRMDKMIVDIQSVLIPELDKSPDTTFYQQECIVSSTLPNLWQVPVFPSSQDCPDHFHYCEKLHNFRLRSHHCLPPQKICDNVPDCEGGDDEGLWCRTRKCPDGYHRCGENQMAEGGERRVNGGMCLPPTMKCDGSADCVDGSDERGVECGASSRNLLAREYFQCASPDNETVLKSHVCDGVETCRDGSDERVVTAASCQPNPCHNGGECAAVACGYRCRCEQPFVGERCEYDRDDVNDFLQTARMVGPCIHTDCKQFCEGKETKARDECVPDTECRCPVALGKVVTWSVVLPTALFSGIVIATAVFLTIIIHIGKRKKKENLHHKCKPGRGDP